MSISWGGSDVPDNRDFVPYPEWMERSPETGEVPDVPWHRWRPENDLLPPRP